MGLCCEFANFCHGLNLACFRETAWDVSPDKYIDNIAAYAAKHNIEALVAVGENDPPEFHRQSEEFAEVSTFDDSPRPPQKC